MINLSFRDLRHDLYVVHIYTCEYKFTSLNKVKGFVKAFKLIGVQDKDIHIYKIICRKEKI